MVARFSAVEEGDLDAAHPVDQGSDLPPRLDGRADIPQALAQPPTQQIEIPTAKPSPQKRAGTGATSLLWTNSSTVSPIRRKPWRMTRPARVSVCSRYSGRPAADSAPRYARSPE